ncbi:MAG: hypothetical protein V4495_19610 [Pseudomonadota bacterium]
MVQNRHSILGRLEQIPGATQLAMKSYVVYLVHKPVFMLNNWANGI